MRRFLFLDNSTGEAARQAASILADCLSRSGYDSACHCDIVTIAGPEVPDETYILLLDESMISHPVTRAHLNQRSTVVVCSARPARLLLEQLGARPAGLVAVDASGIAFDQGADPLIALLGGAARTAPWIDPDVLSAAIWASYDREFAYGARAALRAFDQGYIQAQQAR